MDRVHFDDLTKIDVPLGRLDDDTYNRLLAHDGPIEAQVGWIHTVCYRAKPQPLTKPQVPWENMADWVQYVARDENGSLWGYDDQPDTVDYGWVSCGSECAELRSHKIDPGTCDWRDSLVKRPEGL